MTLSQLAQQRYTAKAYDDSRRLGEADLAQLQTLLQLAPSSVNSQPWHFIFAGSSEAKARIARVGAHEQYAYNGPKIIRASHLVILCVRTDLSEEHLAAVLAQETADGRFADEAARQMGGKVRAGYVALHKEVLQDLPHWMEKQVYIALGSLLLGAATLGIDATAMEGLDFAALDAELGLADKGLRALVAVCLGYHSDEDFNADLPKSRLPKQQVISQI